MALKLKTGPGVTPISLSEAKSWLRQTSSDQDTVINTLIGSVTEYLDGPDGILGRCMIEQTWDLYYDAFPSGDLQVPLGNLIAVDSVQYVDPTSGLYVTWSSSNYIVDTVPVEGWVIPVGSWPSVRDTANAVKVTFRAGYGPAATDVPDPIREAMFMMLVDRFDNRGSTTYDAMAQALPFGVDAKLAPFRRIKL